MNFYGGILFSLFFFLSSKEGEICQISNFILKGQKSKIERKKKRGGEGQGVTM